MCKAHSECPTNVSLARARHSGGLPGLAVASPAPLGRLHLAPELKHRDESVC